MKSTVAFPIFCLLNVAQAPTVDAGVTKVLRSEASSRTQTVGILSGRQVYSATARSCIVDRERAPIQSIQLDRQTTELEHIAGELRRWQLLPADWDGEGAASPNPRSLGEAVALVRLLPTTMALPSPMLHSSGRAGLFWKTERLYADLEFLGDTRLAYYIERNGDKHKGVLNFDKKKMPAVLEAILSS